MIFKIVEPQNKKGFNINVPDREFGNNALFSR